MAILLTPSLLRAYASRGHRSLSLYSRLLSLSLKGRTGTALLILGLVLILGLLPTLISWLTARLADSTIAFLEVPSLTGNLHVLIVFLVLAGLFRFTSEVLQSSPTCALCSGRSWQSVLKMPSSRSNPNCRSKYLTTVTTSTSSPGPSHAPREFPRVSSQQS